MIAQYWKSQVFRLHLGFHICSCQQKHGISMDILEPQGNGKTRPSHACIIVVDIPMNLTQASMRCQCVSSQALVQGFRWQVFRDSIFPFVWVWWEGCSAWHAICCAFSQLLLCSGDWIISSASLATWWVNISADQRKGWNHPDTECSYPNGRGPSFIWLLFTWTTGITFGW